MFNKIRIVYKQYGLVGFIKRIAKFILNKIGININTYKYMLYDIDPTFCKTMFESFKFSDIKSLIYDDFYKGDKTVFTERKLAVIKQRYADGAYNAYGIVIDEQLVFSCWISLQRFEASNAFWTESLGENEVLLMDAYCNPEYRGKGTQRMMCYYRLWKAFEMGKKTAISIVLNENKPSFRSLTKVGFNTAFTYTVFDYWGKTFTNYFNKKQKYRENESK